MGKNKLKRFEENETFKNLFQHTHFDIKNEPFPLKGQWHATYFKNNHPIVLELGCGRGEYTIGMAQQFPDKNFIGIDRKGARIWRGCKDAIELNLQNVAFLRIKIEDIECYFEANEVHEIWVTFPDPQLRKERRRLISPNFISKYMKIIDEKGIIHLKTDSRELYEYVVETAPIEKWNIVENIPDVYNMCKEEDYSILTEIQTFYEKKWLQEGKVISYIALQPQEMMR
ncbi:MAG: tRNA (guanosine(46)-N7)-methyltransferase TrmB [Bacteroidetes bacterium]|nr:tRNA (guanosine(46)-N7)-methyltransferase TrmB [Bacteroidota bacterium]MCL1969028.1 tRNA (guanosine(46)-N7)-methyltransferase TrmB [Bacteroidota bacterium]